MKLRPRRVQDLTEEEKATLADINSRQREEHNALSKPFYEKKHSVGVSPEEEQTFRELHDAIQPRYDQERIVAGLFEEYDELAEAEVRLVSVLQGVNNIRQERALPLLQTTEVTKVKM